MGAKSSQLGVPESTVSLPAHSLQQRHDGEDTERLDDDDQRGGHLRPQQDRRAETQGKRNEVDQRDRPALRQPQLSPDPAKKGGPVGEAGSGGPIRPLAPMRLVCDRREG